jgi:cytosine deaminase
MKYQGVCAELQDRFDTDSGPNAIAELPDVLAGYKNGLQVFERIIPRLFPPD